VGLFHFVPLHLGKLGPNSDLMKLFLRTVCCVLLVGLIGLTSQTMAVARGQAAATGQVTLCTGHGFVVVTTDADGNPTLGGQFCPDCVLVSWADSAASLPACTPDLIEIAATLPWRVFEAREFEGQGLGARGPPATA